MSRVGRCILPYGGSENPATFCPTNGYYDPDDPDSGVIWNPLTEANGWFLLASFQNNSPNSTTFDPTIISSSGDYAWDLGDGTLLVGDKSVLHTYLTTATRTVKLYGKGTCTITQIDFNGDNIVGQLDLSNSAFATLTSIKLQTNASMTSVLFPSSMSGTVSALYIYSTGITGTLDLSMFTTFSSTADIELHLNASMTGVTFASSITGTILALIIHSTGVTSLDLSMFGAFANNAQIQLQSNASMTGITFASTITGNINSIYMYSCGLTGTLDLSMFTTFTNNANIQFNSCTSLTAVTFSPTTITGIIKDIRGHGCTSLGYIDLSKLNNTSVINLLWRFENNGWTAAIVNQVLVTIDSISVSGYTGRVINIGGTNADPDSSSGGYDGSAAKTSLEGKGFTVTIT